MNCEVIPAFRAHLYSFVMAFSLISRFVYKISLLFYPLVSIHGEITKHCQPFCMGSTNSGVTTSCAVYPGCDVIFPLCTFTCVGPEYCDINVRFDFVSLSGTKWSYDDDAKVNFAQKGNFSISDNSIFEFVGVSYQDSTNHDIQFDFYLSIKSIQLTDYGKYNISFYDYFYPRIVFEHTYWLLKPEVTPKCNTDRLVKPFSKTVSAFLLTCSVEDIYHPMDINIYQKESCSFKDAHSVKTKTVKLLILKSYYEELGKEQFRCVSTSRIIPTVFPEQNCTFNFNFEPIKYQAESLYLKVFLLVLTLLVGCTISTLFMLVRKKETMNRLVQIY